MTGCSPITAKVAVSYKDVSAVIFHLLPDMCHALEAVSQRGLRQTISFTGFARHVFDASTFHICCKP